MPEMPALQRPPCVVLDAQNMLEEIDPIRCSGLVEPLDCSTTRIRWMETNMRWDNRIERWVLKKNLGKRETRQYALTVSPAPEVTWEQLREKYKVWKAPITQYGVLEQRSTTAEDRGKGPHLHAVIELKQTHMNNARALCARYWKDLAPATKAVHLTPANDVAGLVTQYYEGDAATVVSRHRKEQDKIWREENKIPHPLDAVPPQIPPPPEDAV